MHFRDKVYALSQRALILGEALIIKPMHSAHCTAVRGSLPSSMLVRLAIHTSMSPLGGYLSLSHWLSG